MGFYHWICYQLENGPDFIRLFQRENSYDNWLSFAVIYRQIKIDIHTILFSSLESQRLKMTNL